MPDLFHRLKLAAHPTSIEEGESAETKLHCTYARTKEIMVLAETQLFVYVLVQVKLLDDGDFKNAKEFSDFIYLRLRNVNKRTLDTLSAKSLYFMAIAYEKVNLLP